MMSRPLSSSESVTGARPNLEQEIRKVGQSYFPIKVERSWRWKGDAGEKG